MAHHRGGISIRTGPTRRARFSAGSATALVRDGSSESTDAPPDFPFVGRLVPAPQPEGELLHASGGQEDQSVRAAWEIFVSTGGD